MHAQCAHARNTKSAINSENGDAACDVLHVTRACAAVHGAWAATTLQRARVREAGGGGTIKSTLALCEVGSADARNAGRGEERGVGEKTGRAGRGARSEGGS